MRMSVITTSGFSRSTASKSSSKLSHAADDLDVVRRVEESHHCFTHEVVVLGDHDPNRHDPYATRSCACDESSLPGCSRSSRFAVLAVAGAGVAAAQVPDVERIERYDAELTIERDGALLVRERIVYDFGPYERHGIFRVVPVRVDYPPVANHDRVFAPAGNVEHALGPFEGMTVGVAIPKGAVPEPEPVLEERFTLSSAFRATKATVGLAAGMLVLLLGLVIALVWSIGRDRRYRGSPVDAAFGAAAASPGAGGEDERVPLVERVETPVEFVPPEGLRPGQVGTLVDFAANPLDVTATIVDLAVRGYLVIEEIDEAGWFRSEDWKLTRTKESGDGLLQYERVLLAGLFRDGDEVTLSDLHDEFASRMQEIRDALERDAVARGWFAGKPGARRRRYAAAGLVLAAAGVGVTIALAKWTHAGLLGLPVVLGGSRCSSRRGGFRPVWPRGTRCSVASRVSAGSSRSPRRSAPGSRSARTSSRSTSRTRSCSVRRRSGRAPSPDSTASPPTRRAGMCPRGRSTTRASAGRSAGSP